VLGVSTETPEPPLEPAAPQAADDRGAEEPRRRGVMIPERAGRSRIETFVMRLVATAGIIGIGVAIAAVMHSQKSQGWLIGLVVSIVSVLLAAFLWSSRRL
jgi:tetrahydromethanopterin S-methyltransferase subunit F